MILRISWLITGITMKQSQVAKLLERDHNTIRTWADTPEVRPFLSPSARGESGDRREFTESDIQVLNTIKVLRFEDKDISWEDIAKQLDEGVRYNLYPTGTISEDSKVISLPHAATAVELAKAQEERDAAIRRAQDLERQLDLERQEHKQERDDLAEAHKQERKELMEEIRKLYRKIGRLEGKLNIDTDE